MMTVQLTFSDSELNWLREKFVIETDDDLIDAVWECISTYMEM
jgi:hypothetical protein